MNATRKLLGMIAKSFRDYSYSSPSWHDRFRKAERGQIAIIFALMIVPMVTLVGFAVDYGRAYRDRTTVQLALDSAVLAAGRNFDQTGDTAQATATGEAFFNATVESQGVEATLTTNVADSQGNIHMAARTNVDAGFLRLMELDLIKVEVESKSLTSDEGGMDVELAVVFDVTGSMAPGGNAKGVDRMAIAKQAATDLFNTLMPPSPQSHSVRVSLVPFSNMVNVGNYAEDATGVTDSYPETYTTQVQDHYVCDEYKRNDQCKNGHWVYRDQERTRTVYRKNCVVERLAAGGHAHDDAPPSEDYFYAFTTTSSWSTDCTPQYPVVPLTYDRQALLDAVDDLSANGGTAGHIGLAWGWYTLSPLWEEVWSSDRAGATFDRQERLKALIIMTDGEFNTQYDSSFNASVYGANGSSASQADELCDNMKQAGVEIFAVGVELTSKAARRLLERCVSDANNFFEEHYYDVADSLSGQSGLRAAFQSIANDIASATGTGNQRLRITR